jgi:hypothetical protein
LEQDRRIRRRLRDGEEIQRKGLCKGGRQTMERNGKPGGVRGTSIACQLLLPGQTPMRSFGSGQDVRSRVRDWRWCWPDGEGEDDRFATDGLEPLSPDATPWPVFPHYRYRGQRGRSLVRVSDQS